MEKNFEVARLRSGISKICHSIDFHNGRGESGLGYFSTLEEAKDRIKSYKIEHPSEKWPYAIIHYQNEQGRIVYMEYTDTCLIETKI